MTKTRLITLVSVCAVCLTGTPVEVARGGDAPNEGAPIRELGNDRYQVGNIVIDKANSTFTVPGKVLRTEGPLEYLAVKPGGLKEYESLLQLDASAIEFNIACILIGLTTDNVRLPRYQFDQEEVIGPPVRITAHWERGGKRYDVPIAKLLYQGGKPIVSDRWRYTGSYRDTGPDRQYMAELSGSLISFVHDPDSIIDHQFGAGIGNYGSMSGNTELLPELGMPLTVTIRAESKDR